jgi:hypothetical protein
MKYFNLGWTYSLEGKSKKSIPNFGGKISWKEGYRG